MASAKVEDDGEVDLLGGEGDYNGGHTDGQDFSKFESSFPTLDTRNEVKRSDGFCLKPQINL